MKSKKVPVTKKKTKENFHQALKSSEGFGNGYGEDSPAPNKSLTQINVEDMNANDPDAEDDFGLMDLSDTDEEDIKEISKSARH